MTAVTQAFLPYGFRGIRRYKLAGGIFAPVGDDGAVDNGSLIEGQVTLELNIPAPRSIVGLGNDGISQIGTLPPQEPVLGTLTAESYGDAETAETSGVATNQVGEATETPIATDQQGSEPLFMIVAWRLCTGLEDGADIYQTVIAPACKLIPSYPGFGSDKASRSWAIHPRFVRKTPLGVPLTRATHKCTKAQFFTYTSENPLNLVGWLGDNVVTEFLFPTDYQGISSAKAKFMSAGVVVPGTFATDGFTPTTKPGDGVMLYSLYETPAIPE